MNHLSFMFVLRFLFCGLFFSGSFFAADPKSGAKFEHFILKYFSPDSQLVRDIFKEDTFFHLDIFGDSVFDLGDDPNAKQFEFSDFPEINLLQRYYYDSFARGNKKILILLFGTLWNPDTISNLRMLSSLYEDFSRESENQGALERQFQLWFLRNLKLGYKRDEVLLNPKKLTGKDWELIQATDRGINLFLPQNIFKLVASITEEISNVPYVPDVTFGFVAVAADDADAQAVLKDEKIPIPFLNDADAKITTDNVPTRVPYMIIVNNEGILDYSGDVLNELDIRARIDRLMVGIFDQRGAEIQRIHHEERVKRRKKWLEEVAAKKRAEEDAKQKKYGTVFKRRGKKKEE